MDWRLTEDAEAFAAVAEPLLRADPVEHTLTLTSLAAVRQGRFPGATFGSHGDGGAVVITPPHEIQLAVIPPVEGVLTDLVSALREHAVAVPGAHGTPALVDAFAAAWRAATGERAEVTMEMVLHRLGALRPPAPPPPGTGRAADDADLDRVVAWYKAFVAGGKLIGAANRDWLRDRIASGRIWLWCDETGTPVAFAGRTSPVAGVARLAPVYTPPEHRRRGYGAAATAACTEDALAREARDVVLFTDADEPGPNALYAGLGFVPGNRRRVVRFRGAPPPSGRTLASPCRLI